MPLFPVLFSRNLGLLDFFLFLKSRYILVLILVAESESQSLLFENIAPHFLLHIYPELIWKLKEKILHSNLE